MRESIIRKMVTVANMIRTYACFSMVSKPYEKVNTHLVVPEGIPRCNISTISQQCPYILRLMLSYELLQLKQSFSEEGKFSVRIVAIVRLICIDFVIDLSGFLAGCALATENEQHWIASPSRLP